MQKELPFVSIITVNYNGKQFLDDCLNSLLNLNYPKDRLEIFIVDNGSNDDSVNYVKDNFPAVKIILNEENNYAMANNLGIKAAKGEYVALVNNDTKAGKDWLITLITAAQKDDSIGALGSKILFMDGAIQSVGHQEYPNYYWGDIGFREEDKGQYDIDKEVISICGCSIVYRKKCLEDIGLLDEDFNMYMEDVDMAIRCRKKGWKLLICPESIIYHKFHGSIGKEDNARHWQETNRLLLIAKHWPEKLADALSGKDYFTIKNGYNNARDISEVMGKICSKLLKEHGYEVLNKLSPFLFESIRRIYNFEKNYLIQDIMNKQDEKNNLTFELNRVKKENQKLEEDISFVKRQKELELTSLTQQKEEELVSLRQQKEFELASLKQEKEQELTSLTQQKEEELNNYKFLLMQIKKELNNIYLSTGYKYLLRPLWNLLWPIKQGLRALFSGFTAFLKNMLFYGRYEREIFLNHLFKKTIPPFPKRLTLMITARCNLRCAICGIPQKIYKKTELSTEECFRIIDAAIALGVKNLELTGGEPFLHQGLFAIAAYAKNKGIKVAVATNGTLIKRYIQDIKHSGIDSLSISIDGNAQIHDELRGMGGVFYSAMEAIDAIQAENLPIGLSANFVVTRKNIFELSAVYRLLKKRSIPVDFWPVNNMPDLYLKTEAERNEYISFVKKLKKNNKLSSALYRYYIRGIDYFKGKEIRVRCLGLLESFGINVEGKIFPCCVWDNREFELGNAIDGNLESVWYSMDYLHARQRIFKKGCSNCFNIRLAEFSKTMKMDFYLPDLPKREPAVSSEITTSFLNKPSSILWTSTLRCNLSCLHCDNWKQKQQPEISQAQIEKVIVELKEWLQDFEFIIGGGEPLLRNDIVEVIKFCSENKLKTTLTSNASLLNFFLCDALLDSGVTALNFSLDGLSPYSHDFTRNFPGLFKKVMKYVKYIADRKINSMGLTISTIIMETNLDEILELCDFTERMGLNGIYFLPLMPNFNASFKPGWTEKSILWPKRLQKLDAIIDALIRRKKQVSKSTGFPYIINSERHLHLIREYYHNPNVEFSERCSVGRRMFSITEIGNILLCPYESHIGSIFDGKIKDIFYSTQADCERRKIDCCRKNCKILGCYNNNAE